jgi:hypothetical protein
LASAPFCSFIAEWTGSQKRLKNSQKSTKNGQKLLKNGQKSAFFAGDWTEWILL